MNSRLFLKSISHGNSLCDAPFDEKHQKKSSFLKGQTSFRLRKKILHITTNSYTIKDLSIIPLVLPIKLSLHTIDLPSLLLPTND